MPGKPDIIFSNPRVVVFVDGDFWHGRDLDKRLVKLRGGHNPGYWVEKIQKNVERDRRHDDALRAEGWIVLRLWEREILDNTEAAVQRVVAALGVRGVK